MVHHVLELLKVMIILWIGRKAWKGERECKLEYWKIILVSFNQFN